MTGSDLAGVVAMVTGGGSGIGADCAVALARRGAHVGVCDVDRVAACTTASAITAAGADALGLDADVTDPRSLATAIAAIESRWGRLDAAVNAAGVGAPPAKLADSDPSDWNHVIAVNLTGVYLSMRAEIGLMRASGGGVIVNIGSVLSVTASRSGTTPYVASKHGVAGLTRQGAADHAADGIRVNMVLPGYVDTPLLRTRLTQEQRQARADAALLRRLAQPAEVSSMVAWLCSSEASFVTGAQFAVDGGYTAL